MRFPKSKNTRAAGSASTKFLGQQEAAKGQWTSFGTLGLPTCVPRITSVLACDPTSAKDPANALLADAEFQPATPNSDPPREAQLVLSPKNGASPPQPTVLFRTLPRRDAVADDYVYRPGARGAQRQEEMRPEDRALRPDFGTLARSDIGVRRVAEMAQWCAEWVGGEGPSS